MYVTDNVGKDLQQTACFCLHTSLCLHTPPPITSHCTTVRWGWLVGHNKHHLLTSEHCQISICGDDSETFSAIAEDSYACAGDKLVNNSEIHMYDVSILRWLTHDGLQQWITFNYVLLMIFSCACPLLLFYLSLYKITSKKVELSDNRCKSI